MAKRRHDAARRLKDPDVTFGQARLAKMTAAFGGVPKMTKSKLAKIAGVSPSMYNEPGYKKALAAYGLTEELVAVSLVADIAAKPKNRFHELTLAADILGMRKAGNTEVNNKTLVLMVSGETAARYGVLKAPKVHEQVVEKPDATGEETI